jgi:diaminopimelate decarboxylase
MEEGEWIIFRNMGAYAMYCDTKFNGFNLPDIHYINENSAK